MELIDYVYGKDAGSIIKDYIYRSEHNTRLSKVLDYISIRQLSFEFTYNIWKQKREHPCYKTYLSGVFKVVNNVFKLKSKDNLCDRSTYFQYIDKRPLIFNI